MLDQALNDIRQFNVIVFDGECALCSGFMRFVEKHDTQAQFKFLLAQSPKGEALYSHFGLKHTDYDTNLVFIDGKLYQKLDTVVAVSKKLGWPWRCATLFGYLPLIAKNWIYDKIARNRYKIFGKYDTCIVPDENLKARFL